MARVKIKTHNANEPRRKTTLLKILSNTDIYPTNIIPTQHGYVVISSHKQQEKIFQDPIKNEFQQHEFTPVTPPELKAKRTVMAFNVNSHIYANSEEEITSELYAHNTYLKTKLTMYLNSQTLRRSK